MPQNIEAVVDREALYEEVWSEPVTVVAPRYGLSDVGLAKICRSLGIPLPSRGYWAKVKAGKIMKRAPLPPVKAPGSIATGLKKVPDEIAAARQHLRQATVHAREASCAREIEEQALQTEIHPLIEDAGRRLRRRDGWPKESGVRAAPAEVFDLRVTRATMDRALLVADRLLKALEPHGVQAVVDGEAKRTLLVFSTPTTAIPVSIEEDVKVSRHVPNRSERAQINRYFDRWRLPRGESVEYPKMPKHDYTPTGILIVRVGRWFSRSWKDTPRKALEERIREVVLGVLNIGLEEHLHQFDDACREDAYRLALKRYLFVSERRAREVEGFERLETDAGRWERASRLRVYADAVERKAIADGALFADVIEWLAWARAKADWMDPTMKICDAILDAPEPKHPGHYW